MVQRRSSLSAGAPTRGLSRTAGASLTATTAATDRWPTRGAASAVKITASDISASRLSQSPRLDRESETHNLLKEVIARTLRASDGAPKGADLLIALTVIDEGRGNGGTIGPREEFRWGWAGSVYVSTPPSASHRLVRRGKPGTVPDRHEGVSEVERPARARTGRSVCC